MNKKAVENAGEELADLRPKAEAFDAIRALLDDSVQLSMFSVAVTKIIQQATERDDG